MNSIPHRTGAIALLSVAQFLVALDFSVVNVALPTMQTQFGASASSLQWVVSAYALMFGGFLLLGGRAADLYGRRRVFMVGMTVFGIASATGAAAAGIATLVAARAAQGIGAATLLPAAVSLIVNLSGEGAARTRAIARLGIIGSAGAAAGVLLGGILTEAISWRMAFWINVPVVVVVVALARAFVPPRSRPPSGEPLDVAGAATATCGLVAIIAAFSAIERDGLSTPVLAFLALGGSLLAAFTWVERHAAAPLARRDLLRRDSTGGASAYAFLVTGTFLPTLVLASSYLQREHGLDALQTGVAFLPMTAVLGTFSGTVSARLIARLGLRRAAMIAPTLMACGLSMLALTAGAGGSVAAVLASLALLAAGVGTAFPVMLVAGAHNVAQQDQGAAAALVNTARQVGAGFGTAILLTLAGAAAGGYAVAFGAAATSALAAAALAAFVMPTVQRPPLGGSEEIAAQVAR